MCAAVAALATGEADAAAETETRADWGLQSLRETKDRLCANTSSQQLAASFELAAAAEDTPHCLFTRKFAGFA